MMEFLMYLIAILLALFVIIMFSCACIISLGVIDWCFELDVKGWLTNKFGERKLFKKVRNKAEEVEQILDAPETEHDLIFPENVARYLNREPSNKGE